MKHRPSGFTFIEILVVMGILVTLMGMVAVLVAPTIRYGHRTVSLNNVRAMSQLLAERSIERRWPKLNGKDFVLSLVAYGLVDPRNPDNLEIFFSPGDVIYTVDDVTPEQYQALTLDVLKAGGDRRALTSYAGRRNADRDYLVTADRRQRGVPIFCDDDDGPIHDPDGLVMGFTDGRARFYEWNELGLSRPEDPDDPEPFLGDAASDDRDWLRALSSD